MFGTLKYNESSAQLEQKLSYAYEKLESIKEDDLQTPFKYYTATLLSRLYKMAVSIYKVTRYDDKTGLNSWDYVSALSLSRSMLDCCNTLLYLCETGLPAEEWLCRYQVFELHKTITKRKVFDFGKKLNGQASEEHEINELKESLKENMFFQSMTEKLQAHYLKGNAPFLLKNEEIIIRNGWEKDEFLGMYKILSTHVHSYPMSFLDVDDFNFRDKVEGNSDDEFYTCLALSMADAFLDAGIVKYDEIFNWEPTA